MSKIINGVASEYDTPPNEKRVNGYYQTNIKTSRNEDNGFALKPEMYNQIEWYQMFLSLLKQYKEIQQENIQLKRQLLEKKCSDKDVEYKEKIKLQQRIDKAIEEIKDLLEHWRGNDLVERDLKILLEILGGGENNR